MGLFDCVTGVPEVLCPKCGAPVTGWQTKDAGCFMEDVHFSEVNNFYAICKAGLGDPTKPLSVTMKGCGTWIEFQLPRVPRPFGDYVMVSRGVGEAELEAAPNGGEDG